MAFQKNCNTLVLKRILHLSFSNSQAIKPLNLVGDFPYTWNVFKFKIDNVIKVFIISFATSMPHSKSQVTQQFLPLWAARRDGYPRHVSALKATPLTALPWGRSSSDPGLLAALCTHHSSRGPWLCSHSVHHARSVTHVHAGSRCDLERVC